MMEHEFSLADLRGVVDSFNQRRPSFDAFNDQPLVTEMGLLNEASEVLEKARYGENYDDELADVFIYLLILSGKAGIDLAEELMLKVAINEGRFPEEHFQEGTAEEFTREYRRIKRSERRVG